MKTHKLPSFLIIGVAKCGTTGLYRTLINHPKIKSAKTKELYFFDRDIQYRKGMNHYKSLFKKCDKDEICGEATPYYFYFENVPERVKKHLPNIKIILLLRNPIDRAYSHFYGYLRKCRLRHEKMISKDLKSFIKIVSKNPSVTMNHRGRTLLKCGMYGKQMKRWLKHFPLSQFKIIKSEDYFKNPKKILNEVFEFIDVDKKEIPIKRYLIMEQQNKKTLGVERYSKLDKETRDLLYNYYKESNELLYKLIRRDMKWEKE